ncbi:MAG TPA: tripartite tricarboxylate transporter TctB family protein [Xanthobacteraceae bacterium]|nr:tripartite tricarboxylate transporter TctB family protein [Xanthobacteraceae bacterium]
MLKIRAPKDFYAGLVFVGIGLLGAVLALQYPLGSALRMGPGYLPTILSCVVVLLGLTILLRAFVIDGEPASRVVWRPLVFVTASIVLFGVTITHVGLVISIILTAVVGGFAARDMSRIELIVLALGLAAFSAVVFVYLLGQPFDLWPT